MLQLYREYVGEDSLPLKPLPIQYKDYAIWQQKNLSMGAFDQQRAYWLEILKGELPAFALQPDKVQPLTRSNNGGVVKRSIGEAEVKGLLQLCRSKDATLFMGLLSLIDILFYKYSYQEDIIVGTSISGRRHADLENQIGCYLNLLPLRVQLDSNECFTELVARVGRITQEAYTNQDYPFEKLVEELNQHSGYKTNENLFNVLLVLKSYAFDEVLDQVPAGITINDFVSPGLQTSKFDCSFVFFEDKDTLQMQLEYNSDLFHEDTMETIANHLEILLTSVIQCPDKPIHMLEYTDKTSAPPHGVDTSSFTSKINTDF